MHEDTDNKHFENIYVESPNYGISLKWACSSCPDKFESKFALGKHKRMCRKPSICKTEIGEPETEDTIPTCTELESETSHLPEPKEADSCDAWECYKCHTEFKSSYDLRSHNKQCNVSVSRRKANPDASGNWLCNVCDTTFPSKRKMNDHKSVAHPELTHYKRNYKINANNEFVCNLCTEVFITRRSVYEHIRKHNGQKALCGICGKFLSDKNNLNKHHQSVHLKQKKHSCHLCDKRYDSTYRLKIHLNSHKG